MSALKRILLVGVAPALHAALRKAAEDQDAVWDVISAASGEEGLARLAAQPFDAVVAELRLPDMDGPRFLQALLVRHPSALRYVLSGSEDRELAAGVVALAHQVVHKPCDPDLLASILRHAFSLASQVSNGHARELVARIGRLPSVPEIYAEITRLMESERATVDNLVAAISQDMAMTAMVLKLANSAFFGMRQTVSDPAEAVSILGIDLLRPLVLAHGLFTQAGSFRFPTFQLGHLWRHSASVASVSKQVADFMGAGSAQAAECFTAGLLHDVGILVLASRFPEEYGKVLAACRDGEPQLDLLEFHFMGAGHGDVGAYLLGLWGIPSPVVQAAALHHHPQHQESRAFTPAIAVHIADSLLAEDPEHELFGTSRLDEGVLRGLGIWDRVPGWRERLEPDASGLRDIPFQHPAPDSPTGPSIP